MQERGDCLRRGEGGVGAFRVEGSRGMGACGRDFLFGG